MNRGGAIVRIVSVEAIPVKVPKPGPFLTSLGVIAASEYGIVVVQTDSGVRGLGEISLIWHGNGAGLCPTVNSVLGPALVGLDPFQITKFHAIAAERLAFGRHSLPAIAAVEMALIDIQGRALGQPAYNLLGGLMRDRIELSMSIPMDTVDVCLRIVRGHVGRGFTTVKAKIGRDSEHDVELVRALRREFGPSLKIRVDANMGWRHVKEALPVIHAMERHQIVSVEQPLPPDDLAGLAELRRRCDVPIMVDESVWGPRDAWRVIQAEAADLINIYVSESGGLRPARQIADLAGLSGVGVAIGAMPEFGIGTAAHAHLGVSLPALDHPSDVTGYLYQGDDLVVTPPPIEDGHALVPPGPGLGVELDEDKLRRYRTDA
jgi:muconate cycloisomerase